MEPENKYYGISIPEDATPEDLVIFLRWFFLNLKQGVGGWRTYMKDDEYEALQFKAWFRRL